MNVDIKGLTEYLATLTYAQFNDATLPRTGEKDLKQGMFFLTNLLYGELNLCVRTSEPYKVPGNSRSYRCLLIGTLVKNTEELYGYIVNGVWHVPEQFLIPNL